MSRKSPIHLPDNALRQLKAERMEKIQSHLEELGKHHSIRNQDLDLVLTQALAHVDVQTVDKDALLEHAIDMASRISAFKLRRLNEAVRDLAKELNVHDAPDHIIWSARQAGVELFPATDTTDSEH